MRSGASASLRAVRSVLAGVLLVALVALVAPPAAAEHVPGGTYTGQTSAGGSVIVVVTADGSAINSLAVNDIRSQNCPNMTLSIEDVSYQPAGLAPIQEHRFTKTLDGWAIEGSFPSPGVAEGAVRWRSTSSRDGSNQLCETGQMSWTATTTAQAPTTPEATAPSGPAGVPTCFGLPATIVGSGRIEGTTLDDVIVGSDGPDVIDGSTGDDVICGGGGDDEIDGNTGNDRIDGGPGNDRISGGTGNDVLRGGDGDDTIEAITGDDEIDGGPGINTCDPGTGRTTIVNCQSASIPAPPPPGGPRVPPTRTVPSAAPAPAVASAAYEGKTAKGNPIRIDTSSSGRTIAYFDVGEDTGRTLFTTSCKQIRADLYWAVVNPASVPIGPDGSFSFTIKGEDDEVDDHLEVSGRFSGNTVNGTLKWVFPNHHNCDSDSMSWSARV